MNNLLKSSFSGVNFLGDIMFKSERHLFLGRNLVFFGN